MFRKESIHPSTSDNFDRVNLFLFQFLAHQIHPYAYALKTFLQPALEQCDLMVSSNPYEAFHLLLSLTKTFVLFIPGPHLIHDEIQQFAIQLRKTMEHCLVSLDTNVTKKFLSDLKSIDERLVSIIERPKDRVDLSRMEMYKHITEILTRLQRDQSDSRQPNPQPDPEMSVTADERTLINEPTLSSDEANDVQAKETTMMTPGDDGSGVNTSSMSSDNPSMFETSISSSQPSKDDRIPLSRSNHLLEHPLQKGCPSVSAEENELPSDNSMLSARTCVDAPPGFEFITPHIDPIDQYTTDPEVHWSNGTSAEPLPFEQIHARHITDKYFEEFGHAITPPGLFGDLCMTYGDPQYGLQSNSLPIGVALSYDESTLLSCDVHQNAELVRLFDIQTGQLKHTITSHETMRMRRPSAVMSTANENIVIVEKESIHLMTPDGRWIQTITDQSIKQLYGIGLFHDRYLLTLDSKATNHHLGEVCRLLLFDPSYGQLVSEQLLSINHQSEQFIQSLNINHVRGKILPEQNTKPRFLAVHGDQIYVADLGRSLIYGLDLTNPTALTYRTIFGGYGKSFGEFMEPSGLCIDSAGNVISADSRNDRIQIFSSEGDYQVPIQLNERIRRPSGICTNRDGTQLYVSCYLAGCVRAFNLGY